jgi:hypothetical protein
MAPSGTSGASSTTSVAGQAASVLGPPDGSGHPAGPD